MHPSAIYPVVDRLRKHRIRFALGGSGMLHAMGLVQVVNDWDLSVECKKEELLQALHGLDWEELGCGTAPFASGYRISIPSLNADVIGNFAMQTELGKVELPVRVGWEWEGIPVSAPEVWFVAYSLMGREEKAALILEHLKRHPERIHAGLVEALLESPALPALERQELEGLLVLSGSRGNIMDTERLRIRRYQVEDLAELHGLLSDPLTMSFWPAPFDLEQSERWLKDRALALYPSGMGRMAVELKDTGELIGDVGLIRQELDGAAEYDLGYIVSSRHWGHGYGLEAARSMLEYGLNTLRLPRICANMPADHTSSRAVAEKLDFTLEKTFRNSRNRNIETCLYVKEGL